MNHYPFAKANNVAALNDYENFNLSDIYSIDGVK